MAHRPELAVPATARIATTTAARQQRFLYRRSLTADRAMLWRITRSGALSGERPIELSCEVRDSPRYLLMSCFASSRVISTWMLCFWASVGASACACLASLAAPAKSPAADLMRA